MGSDHICHYHSVQEPAGVYTRVVMFDSELNEKATCLIKKSVVQSHRQSLPYLIFFKGPTLWVRTLNTSVFALSNAVRLLK